MSVGRPRKFDTQDVLAQSIDVFWRNGYSNTTFADLERATGLHRQSICYAFGDKHSLYVQCLESYCESGKLHMNNISARDVSAAKALEDIFEYWMLEISDVEERGCFILNAISEMAHRDVIVKEMILRCHNDMVQMLVSLLERGIKKGDVRANLNPHHIALQYLSLLDGLILELKIGRPKQDVYNGFESFINMIKA